MKRTIFSLTGRLLAAFATVFALAPAAQAASTITRTSSFDYDPTTGLLIKEVIEPGDSNLCVVTAYTLDAWGHRKTATTRNCNGAAAQTPGGITEAAAPIAPAAFTTRSATTTYSGDQRFVASTTNALNQSETSAYDPRFGGETSLTGPNTLTTAWAYDNLGRKVLEKRADGNGTKWAYQYCSSVTVNGSPGPLSCPSINGAIGAYAITATPVRGPIDLSAQTTGPANGPYTRVYYDTLGRPIRGETQGFDGSGTSTLIVQDTRYNALGQVSQKSQPYYANASVLWTTYAYDTLGRVLTVSEPVGSPSSPTYAVTQTVYGGVTVNITDPAGHVASHTRDAAGYEVLTLDAKGQPLNRLYDPLGNLVQTRDAQGNTTSLVYDQRGRKTAMYDPDMGVWSYTYNALGELVKQVNAKSQATTLAYDVLGRLTTRAEPDLTTTWSYDTYRDGSACAKGIGKLCETTSGNGWSRKHAYDGVGRLTSTTSTIGAVYTASLSYDADGRIDTQAYPTGVQLKTSYTALGYAWKVTDQRNSQVLWTATSADAQGRVLTHSYGNGVSTTNSYLAEGHLSTTQAGASNTVQNLLHSFDAAGRITARIDLLSGVSTSYVHDELNRITSETRSGGGVNPAQSLTWTYDALGNVATKTDNGATLLYTYWGSGSGSSRPHAVIGVSGNVNGVVNPTYQYDADGNLTAGAGRTVSWTSYDKVQSLSGNGATLNYLYDGEHERVQETVYKNSVLQRTTVYLNPGAGAGLYYEEDSGVAGAKKKHYVSAGGQTIALITCTATPCTNTANTTTQYWHHDHLGSVSVITNASGAVVERLAYEPFGKRRNSNGVTDPNGTVTGANTTRGFTEHEHMDEVGLVNMNGRVYDPGLSRFMSADPYIQAPGNLQSYNRYTYGWNSPLGGADPTGYNWLVDRWQAAWHSSVFQAAVTIVLAYNCGYCAADYTAMSTWAQGGSFEQGLKAWLISAGTMGAMGQVGDIFPVADQPFANMMAHAFVGCLSADASGGSCKAGALGGAASAAWANYGGAGWAKTQFGADGGKMFSTAVSAVIGGTASRMGGGSFANGALTGAFGYLYNFEEHQNDSACDEACIEKREYDRDFRQPVRDAHKLGVKISEKAGEALEGAAKEAVTYAAGGLVLRGTGVGLKILEREGNLIVASFKVAKGEARVITEVVRSGDKIILKGTHIQGNGTLKEALAAAKAFGRDQGAKQVIIEGGRRTTGAVPGHLPRPIKIDTGL